jgi:glycosyltransferase involved in cell wall biosynthesis
MRVLQISNTYPPADISGVGTLVLELRRELERAGHEPRVVTREAPGDDAAALSLGGSRLTFPLRAARAAWRDFGSRPYDVLHVHESDGVVAVALTRLARAFGHPFGRALIGATLQVSYRRERLAVRPVVARWGAERRMISRPTAAELRFRFLRAPFHALLGRLTARWADFVVAPSAATARELEEDYGARHVLVVPNGVAAGPEPPRRAASATTRFLAVGRLRTRKAVGVLIEAFDRLRRDRADVELVVIGGGELAGTVAAQVRRLGTADVHLAGAVPRDRIADHLAAADVFVLPSTYEGFPLAILEAMAAGLPVVATRVAGNPEAVDEGITGLLVEPEDAAGLRDAMARLADDAPRRAAMGRAGRELLCRRFAIADVTRRYLDGWSAARSVRDAGDTLNRAPRSPDGA